MKPRLLLLLLSFGLSAAVCAPALSAEGSAVNGRIAFFDRKAFISLKEDGSGAGGILDRRGQPLLEPDAFDVYSTQGEGLSLFAFAPGGRAVAWYCEAGGAPGGGVCAVDRDGRHRRVLAKFSNSSPQGVADIRWAPSGKQVAFLRPQSDRLRSIWVVGSTGKGAHEVARCPRDPTYGVSQVTSFDWNQAGVVYACVVTGGRRLFVAGGWGRTPREIACDDALSGAGGTNWGDVQPRLSPDGHTIVLNVGVRLLAFSADAVDPAARSSCAVRTLADKAAAFAWAPNAKKIAYIGADQKDVWVVGIEGGTPHSVYRSVYLRLYGFGELSPGRIEWICQSRCGA